MDIRVDDNYKNRLIPDVETINPEEKNSPQYFRQILEGIYGSYTRGSTGITLDDANRFEYNRSYGSGKHSTDKIKSFLVGKEKYPTNGFLSTLSQQEDKKILNLSNKAWANVDWNPISPMPKIKAINSKLAEVDYDVVADSIDPNSRDKELDEKARAMFFSRFYDMLKDMADKAGVPMDEPQFIPASIEELNLYEQADGFKAEHAKYLEMLMKYTFDFGDYEEISEEHKNDLQDTGWACLRIEKDPNSGRFYPVYVNPSYAITQKSKHPDHRDIEYGGEFSTITISKLISYGASIEQAKNAMRYYSGWQGNASVEEGDIENMNRIGNKYMNMRVCVISAAWIDCDVEYRKTYRDRNGKDRVVPQVGEEWGVVYNKSNLKTYTVKGRIARQGNWVVGTDIVYGCGKVSNQAREDDRDVLLPYVFYKLPTTPLTEQCIPFIDGLQLGWSKMQNALIVAMNSGHAININMLQNLTLGGDSIDWFDALKMMRGLGVLPFSQSFSGRYEGGAVTPVMPIQGGVGQMLQDAVTIMELNMNNIYTFTGMNPQYLAGVGNADEAVRTSQMRMAATSDVLKPLIKGSFKIKQRAARVTNAMLHTCIGDKGYMKKAYGGILGEAGVINLSMARTTGARMGIRLRVRPTDREKAKLVEAANIALQAGMIDIAVHNYIIEQVEAGANMKQMRLYLGYKIQKDKEQKEQAEQARIRAQSEGVIEQRKVEMQAKEMEYGMKLRGDAQLEGMKHTNKLAEQKDAEYHKRITSIFTEMAKNETDRERILKLVKDEYEPVAREELSAPEPAE